VHELDMMRERLSVEVSQRLGRGSVSLERHYWSGLLVEAKCMEMIGNKVQASRMEGLEGSQDGRCPRPSARGYGKLQ
jgi:hypothetical protein